MRILMIDDDKLGMEGLQKLLEGQGHTVEFECTPDKAAAALKGRDFGFIILDIMIPYAPYYTKTETNDGNTTGIVLLRDLRAGKFGARNQLAEVLVYTAKSADANLPEQLTALGVPEDAIFYKSGIELDDLLARVGRAAR
jgi:CheY-like chemotaxis protein